MTLTVDDEVTLVELAVIVIGVVTTWAIYRNASSDTGPSAEGSVSLSRRPAHRTADDHQGRAG